MDYVKWNNKNNPASERDLLLQHHSLQDFRGSAEYQNIDTVDRSFGRGNSSRNPHRTGPKWTTTLSNTGRILIAISLIIASIILVFKYKNIARDDSKSASIFKANNFGSAIDHNKNDLQSNEFGDLILVNVLFRHGDRAPTRLDRLGMEQLKPHVGSIWPNGLGNLTDTGQLRNYKLGFELSRKYREKLGAYSSDKVLALSSDSNRCINSMKTVLRAFFNFEISMEKGIEQLRSYKVCSSNATISRKVHEEVCPLQSQLVNHFGWPDEWKRVNIDHRSILSLASKYPAEKCSNYNKTTCSLWNGLDNSEKLKTIPGYDQLRREIASVTGDAYDFQLIGFFSDLAAILRYASVPTVRKALQPHAKWILQPVLRRPSDNGTGSDEVMTLYGTYESLNLLGDQICFTQSTLGRLSTSPIITSLLESQLIALNRSFDLEPFNRNIDYSGKSLVLYATHDTLIELTLKHLDISKPAEDGSSIRKNFLNSVETGNDELSGLLGGFKRAESGASLVFELWKTKKPIKSTNETMGQFAYLRLLIYQTDDGQRDVKFELMEMGTICRKSFEQRFGNSSSELESFYLNAPPGTIDHQLDCPFELWRFLTNDKMITNENFEQLCSG